MNDIFLSVSPRIFSPIELLSDQYIFCADVHKPLSSLNYFLPSLPYRDEFGEVIGSFHASLATFMSTIEP